MKRKIFVLFVTLLFFLSSIILPGNFYIIASGAGQTLYVGGAGGGNYTKIQDAIDNASSGDTVFVYNNSYYENVIVNVSINLTGEDKDNTIIDGSNNGTTLTITADWVNLSGFTIKNGGDNEDDAGIKFVSNYTNISGNIIKDCNAFGLFLEKANNNTIYNNTFTNITNTSTIFLWNTSAYNTISNNNITNCGCAIDIGNGSHHNNISDNSIVNNTFGIYLWINTTSNNSIFRNSIIDNTHDGLLIEEAAGNKIFENQFERNGIGVTIFGQNLSNKNMIYHNNFINNTRFIYDECNQTWDNSYPSGGNYWDDYIGDDLFSGSSQNDSGSDGIGDLPYDIFGDATQDSYPLIYSWGEYSPVAEYSYSVEDKTASFNASDSYDRDGTIASYEWDFDDENNGTGMITNNTYSEDGGYNVTLKVTNNEGINDTIMKYIYIGNDTIPPEITNVSSIPTCVGFGFNITINATVIDNLSGVNIVKVNITYPDNTSENFTMNKTTNNVYSYVFSDTWLKGQYNYTVWTMDYADNTNDSTGYSFNVSAMLNISVCTVKDAYGDNETINVTDPPGDPPLIGYELSDDGKVLRIWNMYDSYYFNTSSGIQITNHYDEYWSHNVLMLGYYNNDEWNLIYRTDELSGFNKNISSDDETYVNATLWKNLNYEGYDFRLAIRYHLGVDDNELTIIPYIKNIDDEDIPYILGFAWEINNIQVDMTPENDYIEINGTSYYLNNVLDETYKNIVPPSYYIREDKTNNCSESLYLRWDESLDYKVKVKSRDGEYNAPVTLGIKIGTLAIGQEKFTSLFWHDASEVVYYFDSYNPFGEIWTTNPNYMVDGNENNYASTTVVDDVELCDGNTYEEGPEGTISKLELRCKGYHSGMGGGLYIILRPIFSEGDGSNHLFETGTSDAWSQWFDITGDPNAEKEWDWNDIQGLDCDVEAYLPVETVLYCSKVELRVTYNIVPAISNPYPADGSIGISISPMLNITVSDRDGDSMNISWYSNSSGSWVVFGTNSSVGNGTYHQTMSNASVNGQWWYWKVKADDETAVVYSSVYKFYTGYQSKIENTGSTSISGYLLMQVQYYNSSLQRWLIDHTVIDEGIPRIINSSEQLAFDTIFNGLVNTWNLSYGNGSYRVYAALRDPNGWVLRCDDDSYVEASYDFQVSFSSDSDSDGLTDYMEKTRFHTKVLLADTDLDTYSDFIDIDPLIDLEVTLTVKRIYASEYTYTWREGENWDTSETNTSNTSEDGTEWITLSHINASGGYYTRQNDSQDALDDFAEWNFTVNAPGVYHIWMRSHRYNESCSNVTLWWINTTGVATRIYNRRSDHSILGTEVMWFQNTTDEWKWSWYGVVDVEETGDYTLKINNTEAYPDPDPESPKNPRDDLGWSHGDPEWWMEVDNILITDDPNCIPSRKGIENSTDNTIGYIGYEPWDPPGSGGSAPDFYVKATIAENTQTSDVFPDKYNVLTDWVFDPVNVPDNVENVPITIELWEEDGATDTLCDINGTSNEEKIFNITYNLRNGTWWGDDCISDTDFIGRTGGEVDGSWENDVNLIFNVSQNDYDNDGITYWREVNVFNKLTASNNGETFDPEVTNDRYAVIIGGGASCKVFQTSNVGNNSDPCDGPYLLYDEGSSWTDYTFEVDLMTMEALDDDKEKIGVMFRYQNSENYYILRWKRNGLWSRMYLDEVVNGIRSNIGKKYDWLIKKNWYTLNISLNGNNIKIKRIDNFNGFCRTVFDVQDDSHSSGSIALFCWKNEAAWFDDVRVVDSDGDVLLVEGFDYGIIPSSGWTSIGGGSWELTILSTDQDDIYNQCDFIYRDLLLALHYDEEDIYYLSAAKWRDVDGDGKFDVDDFSVRSNIKYALKNWLKDSSDSNDLNFVYILTHGFYKQHNFSIFDRSLNVFDNDRSGSCFDEDTLDWVYDFNVKSWLESHNYGDDIGRLVFLIDSCFAGHYNDALGISGEDRIIITSSSIKEPAEMETGQDWLAFSHKFFMKLADGETNVATAFNSAGYHVSNVNFMTIDVIREWGYTFWPQDARLDDNGNGLGSAYNLPKDGDWYDVYEGGYRNRKCKTGYISHSIYDYFVTKARVRFNVQLDKFPQVAADLYEFKFYDCDSKSWKSPDGHNDLWNLWNDEENAYDGNVNTEASCPRNYDDRYPYGGPKDARVGWFWTPFIELTLDDPIKCDKIKFNAWRSFSHCNRIDVDVYYSGLREGDLAGRTGL